ncbi:MAG: guanine deaminase [Rhodothalassiaceae bacterium]
MTATLYRGEIATLLDHPDAGAEAICHHPDGLMLVEDGEIAALGPHDELRPLIPADVPMRDHRGGLIVPGFIDCHVHFPQTGCIASPGRRLMDWLEDYVFPAEAAFADPAHARAMAGPFLDALLAHGTTTALVFCSSHAASAEALFEAAFARNMRLIAGDVLMDRLAPPALLRTPDRAEADMRMLIEEWHGKGRLGYAVTPRFAPSCSREMLHLAGRVLAAHPDVTMQTHLAENAAEIALVAELFPQARDYLDVYAGAGLVTERSVFAHAIHLADSGYDSLARAGASIVFCPSSNLFLGSGLFPYAKARACGVTIGLGTDVGAGTSLSLMKTALEAYKVVHLGGPPPSPFELFYLATLGGARALGLADRIGMLKPGYEADFLVLGHGGIPLLAQRLAGASSLAERLFALLTLGDDRAVRAVHVAGRPLSVQGAEP